MKFSQSLRVILHVLCGMLFISPAFADYPDKPIRIISGFAAGGSLDALARIAAERLQESLGQPVIVENRVGAGGMVSARAVANAAPDGYTLLMTSPGFMAASPHLYLSLPYDPVKSFAPITRLVIGPYMLAVRASLPVDDLKGFIELAKAKPESISMANAGFGSATHLDSEYFANAAGIKALHVPYKGSAPATNALLAGDVDAQFTDMSTLAAFVKAGRLKGLAVTGAQRSTLTPNVPTAMEHAMPGFQAQTWFGIAAPAKTPKDIVEKLNRELRRLMATPDIAEKLALRGFIVATTTTDEMAQLIQDDIERMGVVVKQAGIQAK